MLRAKQISERLNLSLATVYALVADGSLPHHKIGGAIRIAEDDLKRFVESCRQNGRKRLADDLPVQRTSPSPRVKLRHLR